MTDWHGRRSRQRWTYREVDRRTFAEGAELAQVTGGELSLSAFDDLRTTGTLDIEGADVPDGSKLVRAYYSFEDSGGASESLPLATLFVSCAKPTYDGKNASGMLECSSVLRAMSLRKTRAPYSVPAGADAVSLAASLARECGLPVSATGSEYRTSSATVYGSGESYLHIANELLGMAGYASCSPDPYGTVVMAPYVVPAKRPVVATFADGPDSVMYPEVSPEEELDVPNVVVLSYEDDSGSMWASAENADPSDPRSTANTDEVTEFEEVHELDGETAEERLANLKSLAASRLADASATVERVSLSHAWIPVWPGDAAAVDYGAAGVRWTGTVASMRVSLSGAMRCDTELRRFVRRAFEAVSDGGVVWNG